MYHLCLENRIFKNIISILLIIILFDIITSQLIINVNSLLIKNIKQNECFSFETGIAIHNVFELKSICVNNKSENEGIIRIDNKNYPLPSYIELSKNERYRIEYKPEEGYEFDHWEIIGGKLSYSQNSSYNYLIVQNNYGEIIAYYRKIEIKEETTIESEIKTTITTSTTSLINSSIKQEKNPLEKIGDAIISIGNTIVNVGKSILEAIIDIGKKFVDTIIDVGREILDLIVSIGELIIEWINNALDVIRKFINDINPFKEKE
ncbi:MAG: hypothetical protein QW806_06250 [Nitrososphaerota archaeon]